MTKIIPSSKETPEQKSQREAVEAIASNLSSLADSVARLISGKLNRRALLTLLAASAKLNKDQVNSVLEALENLKKDWLR